MGGAIAGQSLAKLHTYGPYARVVLELSLVTHVQKFRELNVVGLTVFP
jgi:hypothetical protein